MGNDLHKIITGCLQKQFNLFNRDECTLHTSLVLYHIWNSFQGGKMAMKGRIYPVCLRDLILVAQRLQPLIQLQCMYVPGHFLSRVLSLRWRPAITTLSNYWVCAPKPLFLSTSVSVCVYVCLCNRSARANVSEGHQLCFKHLFLIERPWIPFPRSLSCLEREIKLCAVYWGSPLLFDSSSPPA